MNYTNTISQTGKEEIKEILINTLKDQYELTDTIEELTDLHRKAFNEDYFVIGYYEANKWLEENGGVFNAIGIIQEYENDMFGEVNTKLDNAESVVNMFAYILGEELIYSFAEGLTVAEMLEEC